MTKLLGILRGVEIPEDRVFRPRMRRGVTSGGYEAREIEAGLTAIEPGARVLELGAGVGIVGAVLTKERAPQRWLSVEANPDLIPYIRKLNAHNGLSDVIDVQHGVVLTRPSPPERQTFYVRGSVIGSSLLQYGKPRHEVAVGVPVLRYDTLKKTFHHDVILMDIEGGELEFLRYAQFDDVETIILETHQAIYGHGGLQDISHALSCRGFACEGDPLCDGVHIWRRER